MTNKIQRNILPEAEDVCFDNSISQIPNDPDNVQDAIDNLAAKSTPSFSFGRSGNSIPTGMWLLRPGSVPSNKTGIPMGTNLTKITMITVGNQDFNTFTVDLYEHEGDSVNLTYLTTVTMDGTARSKDFPVSVSITSGRQLACKIGSGSAKNIGVDVILEGQLN